VLQLQLDLAKPIVIVDLFSSLSRFAVISM